MGDIFKNGQTQLAHLRSFGSSWGMLADNRALVFVDNHDNQRGHGGGGNIITYKSSGVSNTYMTLTDLTTSQQPMADFSYCPMTGIQDGGRVHALLAVWRTPSHEQL